MKVSILTVCLNNESTIEKSLNSVNDQTYDNIEHIIQDGASVDQTLKIVQSLSPTSLVESKVDQGLYFALNRAIKRSVGDIIGVLHADDFYPSPNVIENVINHFITNDCDAVYGDLYYVDRKNTESIKRKWISGKYTHGDFLKGWMPPHPSFFVKKSVVEKYGNYDTDFKTAADYEWMLRLIHKHKIKISYLPKVLVSMRTGGQSNSSMWNRIKANKEDRLAWKVNGLKSKWYTLFLKPLSKLSQFKRSE